MSNPRPSRRQLLQTAAVGAVTLTGFAKAVAQQPPSKPRPPALPIDLVKDFVIAGHIDLAKVKSMLESEPRLLNACMDWGGGDFETALEGAGHMGNREIALYLIGQGARQNIFQAAMLGDLETVRSMISAHPQLANSKGPHGIPLKAHARAGKEGAAAVLTYLESLG